MITVSLVSVCIVLVAILCGCVLVAYRKVFKCGGVGAVTAPSDGDVDVDAAMRHYLKAVNTDLLGERKDKR